MCGVCLLAFDHEKVFCVWLLELGSWAVPGKDSWYYIVLLNILFNAPCRSKLYLFLKGEILPYHFTLSFSFFLLSVVQNLFINFWIKGVSWLAPPLPAPRGVCSVFHRKPVRSFLLIWRLIGFFCCSVCEERKLHKCMKDTLFLEKNTYLDQWGWRQYFHVFCLPFNHIFFPSIYFIQTSLYCLVR